VVGVAGGVDVGILAVTTQAFIGESARINAAQDFTLGALASANVSTFGLSVGAGVVGAAGAVSVWSVGTPGSSGYSDGSASADATQTDNGNVLDEAGTQAAGSGGNQKILDASAPYLGNKAVAHVPSTIKASKTANTRAATG